MTSALMARAVQVGGEAAIVMLFKSAVMSTTTVLEDRIPLKQGLDKIVYEMAFKYGRADIVIFHIDGSASVIEVKDGNKGYNHVVSGIGQASLYATQLGMSKGALRKVRKCLLWTSTGDIDADASIEIACEKSGTVPLPWGKLEEYISNARKLLIQFGFTEKEDGTQETG